MLVRQDGRAARAAVAAIVAAAVLVAGCGSLTEPRGTPPHSGGTVRVALTSPTFHALDPQATWTSQQWEPRGAVCSAL